MRRAARSGLTTLAMLAAPTIARANTYTYTYTFPATNFFLTSPTLITTATKITLQAPTGAKPMHATGPFDVDVKPDTASTAPYSRMTLKKHYHGALEADAQGEMLAGGDYKTGNAGYVAIETVTGTLDGLQGTFQIMQLGTMDAGKPDLRALVIPGSGTGALGGLTGTLKIDIAAGKHTYTLDYTLPQP